MNSALSQNSALEAAQKKQTANKKMTTWDYCDNFPPVLCRVLARHKGNQPLTNDQVANNSGGKLNTHEVESIAKLHDWSTVSVREMRAFLSGCGLDFCDKKRMRRVRDYLRKVSLRKANLISYLQKSDAFASYYLPKLKLWCGSYGTVNKARPTYPPVASLLVWLTEWFAEQDKPLSQRIREITAAPES